MQEHKESFTGKGYALLKGAISPEDVKELREQLDKVFAAKGEPRWITTSDIIGDEKIVSAIFNDKIVKFLGGILGDDFVNYSDYMVHKNYFIADDNGWHLDCGTEGFAPYLLESDYMYGKCGIYLQNNTPEYGGAVDVVEAGHKYPTYKLPRFIYKIISKVLSMIKPSYPGIFDHYIKKFLNDFRQKYNFKTVELNAGDFLFFDARLPHKSSMPTKKIDLKPGKHRNTLEVPKEHTKYVIYWNSGKNNSFKDCPLKHSLRRSQIEEKNQTTEPFFSDYSKLKFPDSYPEQFVEIVKKRNVKVLTPLDL